VPSEIAISIDRTLSNVDDLLNEAIEAGDYDADQRCCSRNKDTVDSPSEMTPTSQATTLRGTRSARHRGGSTSAFSSRTAASTSATSTSASRAARCPHQGGVKKLWTLTRTRRLAVLAKAEDVARRLRNLEAVFEGAGVAMAARVGRVIDVWQALQSRMAAAPGAIDRLDLSTYVSKLADSDGGASAAQDVGGGGPSTRAAANDADDRDSKRARTTAA